MDIFITCTLFDKSFKGVLLLVVVALAGAFEEFRLPSLLPNCIFLFYFSGFFSILSLTEDTPVTLF
jgi:hypothetical protein